MKKLNQLRDHLSQHVPFLNNNPELMTVFVENGHVIATMALSIFFECRYTMNIIIERFGGDQDILMAVLVDWIRQYQPELFANPERRQHDFRFEMDLIDNQTAHISIEIDLTERVLVKTKGDKQVVEAIAEPDNPFDK
ncbi:MAG TPA: phage tail protein [Arsenophonus sp.]